MKSRRRTLAAAVWFLMVLLSVGCAALPTTKQETLEERVHQFMQAQIDKKWDSVYSFFDSSFREKVSRESYVHQTRKMSYKGFGIESITMLPSGEQATVKVRIDISFRGYDFKRAPQTQNWVKEKGGWFVKSEPSKNPFSPREKRK